MTGRRTVIVAAAVLLLASACGGEDGTADGGVDDGGIPAATGDQQGPGSLYGGGMGPEPTGTTGETAGGGAAADVSVSLNNYLFDPAEVEVASGAVVEVRNGNTRTPHTFTVAGEDVDIELGPQETGTLTIDLDPGTYDLICRFHEQLGMTGTLTVT